MASIGKKTIAGFAAVFVLSVIFQMYTLSFVADYRMTTSEVKEYMVGGEGFGFRIPVTYFKNEVVGASDNSEYQILAVNLIKGHGYKLQIIDDLKEYRLKRIADLELNECEPEFEGGYDFFRTPGFPAWISAVYLLSGINPVVIKYLNVLLVSMTFMLLALIWERRQDGLGIKTAILSVALMALYVRFFNDGMFTPFFEYQDSVLTESLTAFSLGLYSLFFTRWATRKHDRPSLILGVVIGICNLVKGITVLLLPLTLAYSLLTTKGSRKVIPLIAVGYLLVVIPWSIYASYNAGTFIFLSTQGDYLFVETNNPRTFESGNWSPDKRQIMMCEYYAKTGYINSTYLDKSPSIMFLADNISSLHMFALRKLKAYFLTPRYAPLFISFFVFGLLILKRTIRHEQSIRGNLEHMPALICFVNLLLMALMFTGETRLANPFSIIFIFSISAEILLIGHFNSAARNSQPPSGIKD